MDQIKAILQRENELRLAPETQRKFRNVSSRPDGWLRVVEELQRQVANEFRLPHQVALTAMRQAESLVPQQQWNEIKELSLYRKYNRCVDGSLKVGDAPPNTTLISAAAASPSSPHNTDGAAGGPVHKRSITTLHALLRDASCRSAPLVVFAGSYT